MLRDPSTLPAPEMRSFIDLIGLKVALESLGPEPIFATLGWKWLLDQLSPKQLRLWVLPQLTPERMSRGACCPGSHRSKLKS